MSDVALRKELIRLAMAHPAHRGTILPLVSLKAAAKAHGHRTASDALASYNLDVYGTNVDAVRFAEDLGAALLRTGSADFCRSTGLCKGNLGLARAAMPVIEGRYLKDFLTRLSKGQLDLKNIQGTRDWLESGDGKSDKVSVSKKTESAAKLKATQREINADKAEGMAQAARDGTFDPGASPVLMSSDNYILDGHHRWAAQILRAAKDGVRAVMSGFKVNLPVKTLLEASNAYTDAMGIARKSF